MSFFPSSPSRGGASSSFRQDSLADTDLVSNSHVVWGVVGQNSSSSSEETVKKKTLLDEVLLKQESGSSSEPNASEHGDDEDERKALEQKYRSYPEEELAKVIPVDEKGNLSSIGSLQHANGVCVPCPFLLRSKGCKRSHWCGLCHFDHGTEAKVKRVRPSKGERLRFKKCLGRVTQELESGRHFDEEVMDEQLLPSIQSNPKKKEKFIQKIRSQVESLQTASSRSQSSTKMSL